METFVFCIDCGQKLPDIARFCFSCGKEVLTTDRQAPRPPSSKDDDEDDDDLIRRLLWEAREGDLDWSSIEKTATLLDQRPGLLVNSNAGWELSIYKDVYEYVRSLQRYCEKLGSEGALEESFKRYIHLGLTSFLRKAELLQSGRQLKKLEPYRFLYGYIPVLTLRAFVRAFLENDLPMKRHDIRVLEAQGGFEVFREVQATLDEFNEQHGTSHTLNSFLKYVRPSREELGKFSELGDYKWHLTNTFNDFIAEGLKTAGLSVDEARHAARIFTGAQTGKNTSDCLDVLRSLADEWPDLFSDFFYREYLRLNLPGEAFVLGPRDADPLAWAGLYARYR